jgi:cobalt-zinc-cadmium efflux system protein
MPDDHHTHAPPAYDRAFAVGAALNVSFVLAEVGFGVASHSMALLADAAHNLGDVLGLLLAWGAVWLGRLSPSASRTYGWGRSSILAPLTNAAVLLIGVGGIAVEAIQRIFDPQVVAGATVMWVAAAGIIVNGVTALMFMRGRETDLNIRGVFLHMAVDALVSVGVVIAALLIQFTGWLWIDPVTSLAIAAVIAVGTWKLLRDSVNLALDAVPEGIDRHAVEQYLVGIAGTVEVHDLHIWALSTTDTALSVHLVRDATGSQDDDALRQMAAVLAEHSGIGHATFQLETPEQARRCVLRSEAVV